MKKEKGSALLFVLISCLILSIVGVGMISLTISGTRSTAANYTNIQTVQTGQTELDESIKLFQKKAEVQNISALFHSSDAVRYQTYDTKLTAIAAEVKNELNTRSDVTLEITDITNTPAKEGGLGETVSTVNKFSRVYRFVLAKNGKNHSADLVISPTPSFMQFAIGSADRVNLLGGGRIKGDVYAPRAFLGRFGRYYPNGTLRMHTYSIYPDIQGSLYLEDWIGFSNGMKNIRTNQLDKLYEPVDGSRFISNGVVTAALESPTYYDIYSVDNSGGFGSDSYKKFISSSWERSNALFESIQTTVIKNQHEYVDFNYKDEVRAILQREMGWNLNYSDASKGASQQPYDVDSDLKPQPYLDENMVSTAIWKKGDKVPFPRPTTTIPFLNNFLKLNYDNYNERVHLIWYLLSPMSITLNKNQAEQIAKDYVTQLNSSIELVELDLNPDDLNIQTFWNRIGNKKMVLATDIVGVPFNKMDLVDSNQIQFVNLDINRDINQRTFTINDSIDIRDKILFVDGNLEIDASNKQLLEINSTTGKIIVNGRLIIHGTAKDAAKTNENVKLNAQIFVNGYDYYYNKSTATRTNMLPGKGNVLTNDIRVSIRDVNLQRADTGSLLLYTDGSIDIRRVNAFKTSQSINSNTDAVRMFLYASGKVEVFGVASVFKIQGGIFGKELATVNAVIGNSISYANSITKATYEQRNTAYNLGTFGNATDQKNAGRTFENSRLIITHDPTVFLDGGRQLPLSSEIQFSYRNIKVE